MARTRHVEHISRGPVIRFLPGEDRFTRIDQEAQRSGMTYSEIMRRAVDAWINAHAPASQPQPQEQPNV